MGLNISRIDVWTTEIEDHPSAVAQKLTVLAQTGANFATVLARRAPEKLGKGQVFLSPLKSSKQLREAKSAGFR